MKQSFSQKLVSQIINWLAYEKEPDEIPPSNIDQISTLLKPGDVILIEGYNLTSQAIKYITESSWSHASLFIGCLNNIDPVLRETIKAHCHNNNEPLLIENVFEKIVKVVPLKKYARYHMRICRPIDISKNQIQQIISYAISAIGYEYNIRQLLHLLKLSISWIILPNRLFARSFKKQNGYYTRKTCPSLLASAFDVARFPILPLITHNKNGQAQLSPINPKFFAPKYFDISPYFTIIKYPLFEIASDQIYSRLTSQPSQKTSL